MNNKLLLVILFSLLLAGCQEPQKEPIQTPQAATNPYAPYAVPIGPFEWSGALCHWLPGDFDLDGDVDTADADLFKEVATGPENRYQHGSKAIWLADFNKDGDIDQSDFGVFQLQLGKQK